MNSRYRLLRIGRMNGICSMFNGSLTMQKGKLKQRIFLLFWLTFLLSLSFEISSVYQRFGWLHYLLILAGRIICIAAIVYANIFYFIPKLLRKRRYLSFAVTLLLSAVFLYFGTAIFNIVVNSTGRDVPVFSTSKAYYLTLIFTSIRIAFLAFLLYLAMEWIDQRFSIQELELEKSQVENKYLRNQLNPHFLFNTMNNLHGLILTDTKLASDTVLRLSDFLQYMVYESSEDFIPLEKEMQLIQDYVALEKLRVDKRKQIDLNIDIRDYKYRIAPLLLLPVIENGFKHGINVVEENAYYKINIVQQRDMLLLTTENCTAIKPVKKAGGIGLQNLERRLELLYKNNYQLNVQEREGTFYVDLKVKLYAI